MVSLPNRTMTAFFVKFTNVSFSWILHNDFVFQCEVLTIGKGKALGPWLIKSRQQHSEGIPTMVG